MFSFSADLRRNAAIRPSGNGAKDIKNGETPLEEAGAKHYNMLGALKRFVLPP